MSAHRMAKDADALGVNRNTAASKGSNSAVR
jgi:hypothetical protein